MSSCAALHSCVTLAERVGAADYAARVNEVVACLAGASEPSDVLLLLHQATRELGAERGVFISFVRDETLLSSCRYLLACEPQWCRDVQEAGGWAHDPWLAYATHHSEAIVASRLEPSDAPPRRLTEIAARHGFASAVLVPAHSGPGHARCGLLCLGSATPGYFEADGFVHFRIGARSVAMELHEWWLARLQRELVVRAHITPSDLVLLEHQRQGHSTKRIASALRLRAFHNLLAFLEQQPIASANTCCRLGVNEVYARIRGSGADLAEIARDETDYKRLIARATDRNEKMALGQKLATRRLARGVVSQLDACFAALDLGRFVTGEADAAGATS